MDTTISMIRAGVRDLAAALEFFRQALPKAETVEISNTDGAVILGTTTLLLHSAPHAGPRFAAWFTVTVPDLARVTKAGRKFAAKKLNESILSDGICAVTYVVTQGLAITFKGRRLCRSAINRRRSQVATKKTGKRRLPRESSV